MKHTVLQPAHITPLYPAFLRTGFALFWLLSLLGIVPCSLAADISGEYTFKPVKIGGGGFVTGIIQHPTNGTVYCRTDVGGAFKWNESTKNWTTLMPGSGIPAEFRSGPFLNIEGIAVSKSQANTLYLVVGQQDPRNASNVSNPKGAILKSTDGGLTWNAASSKRWVVSGNGWDRQGGERIAVDPANDSVVYYGSRIEGLWRSENAGGSWAQVPTSLIPIGSNPNTNREPSGVKLVLFDPSQGLVGGKTKRVYIGVAGQGMYRSDDAGTTFTKVYNTTLIPFDADLTSAGVLWVGLGNGGGGTSGKVINWDPATNVWKEPTPTGDADFTVAIDPFNENRVFVTCGGVSDGKIARTTIGTATQFWSFLNVSATYPDIQWPAGTDELNFMSVGDIKFDRLTQDRLWFAQGIGVWRSSDLADTELTWTFVSQGIEEFIGEDIITTPSGMLITAVADRLGFRHANGPDADPGAPIISNQFSAIWSLDWTPANGQFIAAVETDSRDNGKKRLWTSGDNGLTWAQKTNPMNFIGGEIAISASGTSNMVWIGNYGNNPRVTTDGGSNWTELTTFNNAAFRDNLWWSSRRALAADRVNGGVFYLHLPTGDGDFYRSSNNGQTWIKTAGDIPTGYGDGNLYTQIEAVPGKAGHVWGNFNQNGVYCTTNAGDSWIKIPFFSYARAIGFGKQMASGSYPTIFVWGNTSADTTYAIYRSIDQGATWDKIVTYPLGIFDSVSRVTGDLQNEGRVYAAVGGSGMVYGQPSGSTPPIGGDVGRLTRRVWNNVNGTSVNDVPIQSPASTSTTVTSFEAPINVGDNYGQVLDGYLHPATTGSYTFWIAGDDNVELRLSTDANPSNAIRVAWHTGWTNSREWGKYGTQKSAAISLTGGQKYYVQALMKEAGGGDNLAVSWRMNNTTTPANNDGQYIIPGSVLSPWEGGGATEITRETYDPPAGKSSDTHRVFNESTASGGSCAILEANASGDYVICEIVGLQAAPYRILIRHKTGSNRGVSQLGVADTLGGTYADRGNPIDHYQSGNSYVETETGTVTFTSAGTKFFRFNVNGKNSSSSGFQIAIDRIRLVPR